MTSAVFVLSEVASYADVRPKWVIIRNESLRTSGYEANNNKNSNNNNNNRIFIQDNPSV